MWRALLLRCSREKKRRLTIFWTLPVATRDLQIVVQNLYEFWSQWQRASTALSFSFTVWKDQPPLFLSGPPFTREIAHIQCGQFDSAQPCRQRQSQQSM